MISLQWDPPLAFAGTKIWNWDGLGGSQEIVSRLLKWLGVQWHPLAGMIRNETILTRANWWKLNEFDVYCTMVCIYFYLSTWIFKSKGSSWQAKEKLANQSSEEESKSTADKDVEEDEWSLEHVLEFSRFRLRLTLICNIFFCNFFYMFVQFAAITVVPPM